MTIKLYNNLSEYRSLDKQLTELVALTGSLREESSIITPAVTVEGFAPYIATANYAYIPDFGRYYFIEEIESVRTGLWRLTLRVDVLFTYRDSIRANSAIIERNQNMYDLKLNDGLFQTQQNPRIAEFSFPAGFDTWNFVLAVAGN